MRRIRSLYGRNATCVKKRLETPDLHHNQEISQDQFIIKMSDVNSHQHQMFESKACVKKLNETCLFQSEKYILQAKMLKYV